MKRLGVAGVAMVIGVLAPSTPAVASSGQLMMRYSFDSGLQVDDTGRGRALMLRTSGGGTVAPAGGIAAFPARCAPANGRPCPRAILQAADDPAVDPGTRAFHFAASLRLPPGQTSAGSNVIQKGYADARSQWKLQIDGYAGLPSCVLVGRGARRVHLARSPLSIADGLWHRVTCRRTAGTLSIEVDGVTRASVPIPAGLSVANDLPVRIGGKNPQQRNDQFHGQLDEVVFYLD